MKAVIFAGGLGTRLAEETNLRPKPMVEIGGRPILWHIMKQYHASGIKHFIICCGHKSYVIKEYFINYRLHMSDVVVDGTNGCVEFVGDQSEDWRVRLVDTGERTMTGGRLARVRDLLDKDESFCLTYGDGVSDIDISKLINFHKSHGRIATITAVRPPGRFGVLSIQDQKVTRFEEKPVGEQGWINGGFFVLRPEVVEYLGGDDQIWEHEPLERLAAEGELCAFEHHGFWQPMDTLRDKNFLEALWQGGNAPWKCWS